MRKIATLAALLGVFAAAPVAAQMFSDGYEFLKAVDDRDGDAVTAMLDEPGTTIINTLSLIHI